MPALKLLIVTQYFPPCAAVATHRMIALARYLPDYNWDTIVIAPPHVHGEPTDPNLVDFIPAERNIIYSVPFTEGFFGKVNRKFFPNYLWILQARRACKMAIIKHKPDVVLTTFPPAHIHHLGLWMNKKFKLPWIADFRDPWISRNPSAPKPRLADILIEKQTIERADLIVTTSPSYTEELHCVYPAAKHKIVTITNGYDPTNFQAPFSPPPRAYLSLLYSGELYVNRNPLGLLDALQALELEPQAGIPKIGFHFIGRSNAQEYNLPMEVQARGLEHLVVIEGLKPYTECLKETAQADILVLIQSKGYNKSLPAKLFEYIGAKRPILVLAEPPGDICWVLNASGILHRIAPITDVEKIKQAIIELVLEMQANKPIVTPSPISLPFTREDMVRQFAQHLKRDC